MNKTEQNKTEQKELFEKGLYAIQKELFEILKNTKQVKIEKTNTFILKAYEHFLKYGDSDIFKKLFFVKVGNTTLYNKLGLARYFEACDLVFSYNVKKDSLRLAYFDTERKGLPLKYTFLEYQNIKKESLTPAQKEQKLFERLAGLPNEQKDRLLAYLKNC